MQDFIFTLVLLFTLQTVQAEDSNVKVDTFDFPDDCWYTDKTCDITTATPITPAADYDNPTKCRQYCVDQGVACTFWTYLKFIEGKPECYALTDCVEAHPHCDEYSVADDSKCGSGPNPCPIPENACTKLSYDGAMDKSHWTCFSGPSPYAQDVESGTTCSIDCPTWTNSDGVDEPTLVSSTCTDGNWETPIPATVMDSDDPRAKVEDPSKTANPACFCNQINIKGNTLAEGTELYEKSDPNGDYTKVDITQKVEIKGNNAYIMFCDRHLVLDISCSGGVWSEGIHDCTDIYCWEKPASLAECDGTRM